MRISSTRPAVIPGRHRIVSAANPLGRKGLERQLKIDKRIPETEPLSSVYRRLIEKVGHKLGLQPKASLADLKQSADRVEAHRQAVAQAAFRQIDWLRSGTFEKLRRLNPAERAWLKFMAKRVHPLVTEIFDLQSFPGNPQQRIQEVMELTADKESRAHYRRIRSSALPRLRPAFVPPAVPQPATQFASSVPWFPQGPTFSAMWPADIRKNEFRYLRKVYSDKHPVNLPYTVVERLTAEQARRMAQGGCCILANQTGERVEWIVRGLRGQRYRVVNICFHERFQQPFLAIAQELLASARIEVKGHRLHPQFRKYLITVAKCIREGDFDTWIAADTEQTEGNLFFTLFPHEGYWGDNLKFPFIYGMGVRDLKAIQAVEQSVAVIGELEQQVTETARKFGMTITTKPFRPDQLGSMVQFYWAYQTGGMFQAFADGSVAGHDYPKVKCYSTKTHRTVLLLDTLAAVASDYGPIANQFLSPELAVLINATAAIRFALWHEVRHGIEGNRPDTKRKDGRIMGEYFGDHWAAIAEPESDMGSLIAASLLYRRAKYSRKDMMGIYLYVLIRALIRYQPKKTALNPEFIKKGLHTTGTTLFIGYLFLKNRKILKFGESGKLDIDFAAMEKAVAGLDEEFLKIALTGTLKDYIELYKKCVNAIPDAFLEQVARMLKPHEKIRVVRRPPDRFHVLS